MDREDSKLVGLVALLQVCLIVGGSLVVFGWSKIYGYSANDPAFSSSVHFIRNDGLWLLLFPIVWTLLVTLIPEHVLPSWLEGLIGISGIVVTMGLVLFYISVPLTGYRPPMLVPVSSFSSSGDAANNTQNSMPDRAGKSVA